MKLCIFGAGAVGGHLAARLAARHEVSVVARGAHLEAMRAHGLKLLHGDETIVGHVRAAASAAELDRQDAVLVTLKANMLEAFAAQCAPLLGRETAVVFIQNGIPWWHEGAPANLDPGGRLAAAIAPERVIGGVAYSANEVIAPGVVENRVPGNNMVVLGRPDREETPLVLALRQAFEELGISSPVVADIRQAIWAKLAQNVWTSTLCTLTGLTVRAAQELVALQGVAAAATAEARAIASALGVDVAQAPRRPSGQAGSGAAHKPSMLQDYERGRPMEVDAQLVAPLELGRKARVHTPTLEVLVPLVAAKAAAKGLYRH